MKRNYQTYTSDKPIPPTDIRVNKGTVSWIEYSQQNKQSLQLYNLIVNEIISSTPISFDELGLILKVDYLISKSVIDKFFKWLQVTDTTGIKFVEPIKAVR